MLATFSLLALLTMPAPQESGERLNVLFIGDRGHHQPEARLHDVHGALLRDGYAIDWEDRLEHIDAGRLEDYDTVLMYANQSQHTVVPQQFFTALRDFVREGGGFVALHCTSGCFMQSQEWLEFVGARFVSHGDGVFQQEVVAPEHPLMVDWENYECWDETYVQDHHPDDRLVLTKRGEEPWSWIRREGQGRVFYSASGHDARTWTQPGFLEMLKRSLDWTAGPAATAKRKAFKAPEFTYSQREWAPNYEGRDPQPPMQEASTPQQAVDSLIVPAGFRAELFACEPMVVNPIAMAWDERGRLWIAESPDYPNTVDESYVGKDSISVLEDTDGDGRADKKTVFRDKLNLPTSILKVKGGILVTQAPDLLFLRDDDNDDVCDAVEVVFSGFGRWDTHAGPANLKWGPDNSIWGSVGYSSFEHADGRRFGSGLWSYKLGDKEPSFQAQFTNNTWGLGFRADGEVFGSTANGAPSFFMGAPKSLLQETAPNSPGAAPIANTALFHPAVEILRQGDYFGQYTSAAGHNFATGSQMPRGWNDRTAFVCGPTGHLVGRMDSYASASGWRSRDAFNLCVSVDDWFCPVQAEVGPDGAIWIADFSQFIILHNLPGNPERGLPSVEYGDGNAHLNPLRDTSHGRIFRLVREGAPKVEMDLRNASAQELAALLQHPNRFWRTTARRLIIENARTETVEYLLLSPGVEELRTLAGLGALDNEAGHRFLAKALQREDVAVLKAAMAVLPATDQAAALLAESALMESPSADLRRHAMMAAARMPESSALGVALAGRVIIEDPGDPWIPQVMAAAIAAHADPFLAAAEPMMPPEQRGDPTNLFTNGDFELEDPKTAGEPLAWRVRLYQGEADHTWEEQVGRGGSRGLVIRSKTGADTSWCTDVVVQPNTRYRLSGWIHTHAVTHEGQTHGALLNIHPRHVVTRYVQDDSDWVQVSLEFQTGAQEHSVSINCLYGGWGKSTGEAVYDDLELVSLGPASDLKTLVNLAKRFASDSPPAAAPEGNDLQALLEPGDIDMGRDIFFNNQTVACNRCHSWDGVGGGLGADLGDVGLRLSREKILESILEPNAEISESWPSPSSAMPALRPFLSDQQIRDLVSFLAQTRK
ncbi:MAG: ThuA domain-containing protein [Planctomycetota bacterium]|nr:ThuA domain-containing protein [Planctomycetota bacterium]